MAETDSTCWTVIQAAAWGNRTAREQFAERYIPVVRAYLSARWRNSPYQQEIDDAVQEVFVECFRQDGVLQSVEPGRPGGFRAFLYGVARNVALRVEARLARQQQGQSIEEMDHLPADEDSLSKVFDRAWAVTLLRRATQAQRDWAQAAGAEATRRVELLHLRFHDRLPIREIARRWQTDPVIVHRQYAKAREEFRAALLHVLQFHHPDSVVDLHQECAELLGLLA